MKHRAVAVLFAAGLLGGCTDADWDHALSYAGLDSPQASEPVQPAPVQSATSQAAPVNDEWCTQVANAARAEATSEGFDQPTQERRAQQAFQQCRRAGSTMQ